MKGFGVRGLMVAAVAVFLMAAGEAPLEKAATSYVERSSGELESGVVVIPAAEDRGVKGDVAAYTAGLKEENPKYAARLALNLIAAGPRLDSGDEVTVGKLVQKGNDFTMTITYTSARVRGAELRRNIQWTPLAFELVPQVAAGKYTLKVTWQCSDAPGEGQKKPEDIVQETKFEIVAAK